MGEAAVEGTRLLTVSSGLRTFEVAPFRLDIGLVRLGAISGGRATCILVSACSASGGGGGPGVPSETASLFAPPRLDLLEEALIVGADRDKGRDRLEPLDDRAELLHVGEADDDLDMRFDQGERGDGLDE